MSVTGVQDPVQERIRTGLARVFGVCLCAALGGCTSQGAMNPVDWWHDLEGGQIAAARPPPPNADAPVRNLSTVPKRPATDPTAARTQIATRLQANRASGEYAIKQDPLTGPPAAPARPAPATAPAEQPEPMGATLQAASAPPPAPALAPTPTLAPAPQAAAPSAAVAAPPMPPIPSGPPPPPSLPGVAIAAATRPSPPAVPPPAPAPLVQVSTDAVSVPFTGGSAALSPAAVGALKQLAQRRGTAAVAVTGYGDAASTEAEDQAAALPLAWSRAQAIANALQASGVPAGVLRLTAEAGGRGGVATLAD